MSGTRISLSGWLARTGFADVPRAERELTALGITGQGIVADGHPVLAALARAADPDLALAGLAQVAERDPGLIEELVADQAFRIRLTAALGVSKALADHLARHPADSALLRGQEAGRRPDATAIRAEFLRAVAADPAAAEPRAGQLTEPGGPPAARPAKAVPNAAVPNAAGLAHRVDPAAQLAAAYHGRLLHLAARDVTGVVTVDEVAAELADLADAVLEAALAIARAEQPPDAAPVRIAVVAMGKCGARELNYASDIDVIFIAEPLRTAGPPGEGEQDLEEAALRTATKLAAGLIRVCDRTTPEGALFPVDPNLRPEGRQGPLVRTLASHLAYYDRWAKTWEFQALLKARPAAGDLTLGKRYADAVAPLVWQASQRENFVEDVQAMRRRVIDTLPKNMAGRELKLGPGGLRDIEFAVQLLQLVHGRSNERLRVPATLPALAALADEGYVGRADAEDLGQAYRFLRQTEHLLQLYQLRRTHTLPTDPAVLRRLGRALGGGPRPMLQNVRLVPPDSRGSAQPARGSQPSGARAAIPPEQAFTEAWTRTAQRVRRLHEKLFYRPLLDAVAKLPSSAARLTPEAARARLEALGYRDPAGALRHIEALTSGLRRRAAIQRTLLPVLLGWFADAAEPDAGLLAFRQVSDALGDSPWFLRLLRDETKAAERMACVLASSRYATGLLLRAPEAVALFADDAELVPKSVDALRAEMMAAARRYGGDAEQAAVAVRSLRRRELFRVAVADVLGLIGLGAAGEALTAITTASLDAVLAATIAKIETELRGPLPTRFAVIAMGRYGGHESGFGSDADVIFVHEPLPGLGGQGGDRAGTEGTEGTASGAPRTRRRPSAPSCAGCCRYRRPTRPWRWTPTCGRRGRRARWSGRSPPARRTTRAAPPRGSGRRCCAPSSRWATRSSARGSSRSPTSAVTRSAGSATRRRGRSAGSRRASRRSGSRARRTARCTSSSAPAACRTWSGPSSCCSCSTATPFPACAPPGPSPPWTRPWRPASSRPPTRARCARRGTSRHGPGTRSCWSAAGPATPCRAGTTSSPRSPGCSATSRPASRQTATGAAAARPGPTPPRPLSRKTTAAPPAAPARSWTSCSTASGAAQATSRPVAWPGPAAQPTPVAYTSVAQSLASALEVNLAFDAGTVSRDCRE